MLKTDDLSAVKTVRGLLDDVNYAYMSQRLIPRMEVEVFPDFASLQGTFKSLYPIYRLLFTLFWQGHAADEAVLRRALAPNVFAAMTETGLLVQDARKHWRTPGVAVVPFEGLYLAVSLPPHYPTAPKRTRPFSLGQEAVWLTKSLPASTTGRRGLALDAGSGAHGLVCAARGASHVVCLERSSEAVAAARFNAALNNLSATVEVRQSELLEALGGDEKFDLVVAASPFAPPLDAVEDGAAEDASQRLQTLVEALPPFLSPDAAGVLFCYSLGDQFSIGFNQRSLARVAKENGLYFCAYVSDKISLTDYIGSAFERKLTQHEPGMSADTLREKVAAWREGLRGQGVPSDYIYEQLIRFWNGRAEGGLTHMPIYNPLLTDPLVKQTTVAMLRV